MEKLKGEMESLKAGVKRVFAGEMQSINERMAKLLKVLVELKRGVRIINTNIFTDSHVSSPDH